MRLLSVFFARVLNGVFRQIVFAVVLENMIAGAGNRFGRQVGTVGSHVGDVTGLIKALCHRHGFLDAETESGARRLLQS